MDAIWTDLKYAIRSMRAARAGTAVALVTLAAAIAANAGVFAVLRTVLLNPLPYPAGDRLVTIVETDGRTPNPETVSAATVRDFRDQSHFFDHLSVWRDAAVRPIEGDRADQLRGMRVDVDFFDTLGVPMYLGRNFLPEDQTAGRAIVLTYGTWLEHFGGNPATVGRSIPAIDGTYQVVGVLPPSFHPLHMSNPAELPRVFLPHPYNDDELSCRSPACRRLRVVGRLAPGVSAAQAQAGLTALMGALRRKYPGDYAPDAAVMVTPLKFQLVGRFAPALWTLEAAVLLLLVLASTNVSTWLLARAFARETEMAIRAALGAGRGRLIRQLLTESALLAFVAALIGLPLAWATTLAIAQIGSANIPRISEVAPDRSMLFVGIAAGAATVVLFGMTPALVASRSSAAALRSGTTARRFHPRLLGWFVAAEIGMAFVLVFVVGLLGRSYLRLMHVDVGFDPEHLLTLSLLPDDVHYDSPARHIQYFDAVADRMGQIPGVRGVAYASTLPLSHPSSSRVFIREQPLQDDAAAPSIDTYLVSSGYFEVMRIPIRSGRAFTSVDGQTRVAVVSESAARLQFGGADPVGRHIQVGSHDDRRPWATIVGVVGDVHQYGLDRPPDAAVYLPFAHVDQPQGWASLVVRSAQSPERIEPEVRAAMIDVDPLQPIFHLQPMTTYVSLSVAERTFTLAVVTGLGLLAFVLAVGGVYAVVAYTVERRTRELGLRMALGASASTVCWAIVRQVLTTAATGIAGGLVVAAAAGRAISSLLFQTVPLDPATIVAVAVVLVGTAVIATAGPVVRAARIDPAVALRAE